MKESDSNLTSPSTCNHHSSNIIQSSVQDCSTEFEGAPDLEDNKHFHHRVPLQNTTGAADGYRNTKNTATVITIACVILMVVLHGVSANNSCAQAGIEITVSPNHYANNSEGILELNEHDTVFLPCEYRVGGVDQNKNVTPFWQINGKSTFLQSLPPRHNYNGKGIKISDVTMNLNMWTYICCFDVVNADELCESENVTLMVSSNANSAPNMKCPSLEYSLMFFVCFFLVLQYI